MEKLDLILDEARNAFTTERERTERLASGTEKQLGAAGLLIAANILGLPSSEGNSASLAITTGSALYLVGLAGFGLCLALLLFTFRSRPYVAHSRGSVMIDELASDSIDGSIAKVKIAKMYLQAREKNAKINDGRARELQISGLILTASFVLAVAGRVLGSLLS